MLASPHCAALLSDDLYRGGYAGDFVRKRIYSNL